MAKKAKATKTGVSEQTEWKAMIMFKNEDGHFHPLKLTKAIDKEMVKISLVST